MKPSPVKKGSNVRIRVCDTVETLKGCVALQQRVFDLPWIEVSPVRHFIVTNHAGGFTLGAFADEKMIGFCLSVPAFLDGEMAFYSHMTAVDAEYQSHGLGTRLKFKQREHALSLGVKRIKWTFQPEKALNANFNLEKLGAMIREYMPNYYGTDYGTEGMGDVEIRSDRLFAVWELESEKARTLAEGRVYQESREPVDYVVAPRNWNELLKTDRAGAAEEQRRIRKDFENCFSKGLICRGFEKDPIAPRYVFYEK